MGKIYDADGNKMGLKEIVEEAKTLVNAGTIAPLRITNTNQYKLAHNILDIYKHISSNTEAGMRLRKLLDNLMTKYQKSTAVPTEEEQKMYGELLSLLGGNNQEDN